MKYNPMIHSLANEFMAYCNDVLGAYLDALSGISRIREDLIRFQEAKISEILLSDPANASEMMMDQQPLSHEFEQEGSKPQKVLHRRTQGEFKLRTENEGLDARLLGYMAITLLYGAWEDNYRERFATAGGYATKNDLKSNIFGDLGKLRNAIVHNNGQATKDVASAKILSWFRYGQTIFISSSHVDELVDQIDAYITKLSGISNIT